MKAYEPYRKEQTSLQQNWEGEIIKFDFQHFFD